MMSATSLAIRITVVLLAAGALFVLPSPVAQAATVNIAASSTLGQAWFCNSTYQGGVCPTSVNVGDTVQWDFNGDIYSAHSTRHCSDGCDATPSGTPLWDSPTATVHTFSFTFNSPGVYPYQCEIHPLLMQGEITVVGDAVGGVAMPLNAEASAAASADSASSGPFVFLGMATVAFVALATLCGVWLARRRAVDTLL